MQILEKSSNELGPGDTTIIIAMGNTLIKEQTTEVFKHDCANIVLIKVSNNL